jgi:hypothetical protein
LVIFFMTIDEKFKKKYFVIWKKSYSFADGLLKFQNGK